MAGAVTYLGGGLNVKGKVSGDPQFRVTIIDQTRGWEFSTTSAVPGAQLTSAEWIAESPYGCNTSSGFCPLSDFVAADYGAQYTAVPYPTSYAIVGGRYAPIGSFGNSVQEATMVSYPNGTAIMAQPSGLQDNGTSFSVAWSNAGP